MLLLRGSQRLLDRLVDPAKQVNELHLCQVEVLDLDVRDDPALQRLKLLALGVGYLHAGMLLPGELLQRAVELLQQPIGLGILGHGLLGLLIAHHCGVLAKHLAELLGRINDLLGINCHSHSPCRAGQYNAALRIKPMNGSEQVDRYHRQALLPEIGPAGQARLRSSSVLMIGCGALGCSIAQQLVRSGIGKLRLVDRDLVDITNLHRQVLFTDQDAREQSPKALAAAEALRQANPDVQIEPIVADVHSQNIADIALRDYMPDVILDGTDNVQIRYLINDLSCRDGIPWVYGACIGMEGRVMSIVPGKTACLRCIFPDPPAPGTLQTCDTAGVLGAAPAVVGALQAAQAIRLILDGPEAVGTMLALNVWTMSFRSISTHQSQDPQCLCCRKGQYEFLNRPPRLDAAALCGRNAVQVRPVTEGDLDLVSLAGRLEALGEVTAHPQFARFRPTGSETTLSIFPDGRVIVNGTADVAAARSLVARYIGG